jgi:hypothetical protein
MIYQLVNCANFLPKFYQLGDKHDYTYRLPKLPIAEGDDCPPRVAGGDNGGDEMKIEKLMTDGGSVLLQLRGDTLEISISLPAKIEKFHIEMRVGHCVEMSVGHYDSDTGGPDEDDEANRALLQRLILADGRMFGEAYDKVISDRNI